MLLTLYFKGVEESGYAIREKTVRLPFTTNPSESESHSKFVKKEFVNFVHSAKQKKVEVFVTANIVLTNLERSKKS